MSSMNQDVELRCRCGEVHGQARGVSPATVNRVICYCDDCQAFMHHLGRADLLDAHGGTDIVQVAPSSLTFDRGTERIAALRLSPKGVYRWHSSCCKTPLGNTVLPSLPFVGIPIGLFVVGDAARRDELFGKADTLHGKFAIGAPPAGSTGLKLGLLARSVRIILGWKLAGKAWPHPYFDRNQTPAYPVTTIPLAERTALRPLCGPKP